MIIRLNSICPTSMADTVFSKESIWKNQVEIDCQLKHLILAPSGTGKTSLLAFLFGMRKDFSSTIEIDGKITSSFSLSDWTELRKSKLSCVFQDMRLLPHLTVKENLLLKNCLTNFKSENEIKALLERLNVGEKWTQTCGTLSFGQQQRVAIVRALLQPFTCVLLDEPFSHLDQANTQLALQLIVEACEQQQAGMILFSLGEDYGISFDKSHRL